MGLWPKDYDGDEDAFKRFLLSTILLSNLRNIGEDWIGLSFNGVFWLKNKIKMKVQWKSENI